MRTSAFANGQTWDLPVPAQGASTHARFFDPAGPPSLAISCLAVLPSAFETASAPGIIDFVAPWLATFTVSDFHRLLLAGLPAHFESDQPPVRGFELRCDETERLRAGDEHASLVEKIILLEDRTVCRSSCENCRMSKEMNILSAHRRSR